MERLTFIDHLGWYVNGNGGERIRGSHINRLAAYEDSGLEPEDVRRLQKDWTSLIMTIDEMGCMPHLCELYEAEKEGRLVVLPCKVGDGLWTFCSHPVEQVYSFTVTDISTLNGRTMLNTSRCGVIDARDVGKTVFLTREEAEAALKGGGSDA